MFSGLKYIFGYVDESDANTNSASNAADQVETSTSIKQQSSETPSSVEQQAHTINQSGSALLEQTLNAATTKFTEQLLPPQASIEQLHSSSQHLLPSITEQHEEDKLKKSKELAGEQIVKSSNEEDDDCIEVESWELLDLVEKAESSSGDKFVNCGLDSIVQVDESSYEICKATTSSGGILKTSNNNVKPALLSTNAQQQTRQKPKVSFDTPDLVSDNNNYNSNQNKKIEQQEQQFEIPRATNYGEKSKESGKIKKKRNQQRGAVFVEKIEQRVENNEDVQEGREKAEKEEGKKLSFKLKSGKGIGPDSSDICSAKIPSSTGATELVSFEGSKIVEQTMIGTNQSVTKSLPVLNYAAALSKKPVQEKNAEKRVEVGAEVVKLQPQCSTSGSNKRNRALSTSSWSSSDELWPETEEKSTSMVDESCFNANNLDDNDSIVSSGFSDCDYGYEGVNDYYLRPKKGHSKRVRNSSSMSSCNSSSLLTSISRRCGERVRCAKSNIKVAAPNKEQKSTDSIQVKHMKGSFVKTSMRPKKKKISLAMTCSSQDFLKKTSEVKKSDENVCEPPVAASSNDSSDIAEMDESWYVTPPPCFTGANRSNSKKIVNNQPKAKEAARENELIEHPAVPPPKPNSNLDKKAQREPKDDTNHLTISPLKSRMIDDAAWDVDDENDTLGFDMEEAVWIQAGKHGNAKRGKYQNQPNIADSGRQSQAVEKQKSKPALGTGAVNKQQTKLTIPSGYNKTIESKQAAWKNKFKVDDWDFDDREDADSDFDNIFEPAKKNNTTSKVKKHRPKQSQHQRDWVTEKVETNSSELGIETNVVIEMPDNFVASQSKSVDCDSDLISMESNSSSPLGNKENQIVPKERRLPTQVRPIEPERKPGWQLKRQRSKRRPISGPTSSAVSTGTKGRINNSKQHVETKRDNSTSSSDSSTSARSTPTLIDRIGSSIVANINNLTSGLVSSGALHSASGTPIVTEDSPRTLPTGQSIDCGTLASGNCRLVARKLMSKGFLKRQNICARQANSQRRPDRRLKMFATPNGCSINRKVQTNFH